MLKLATACTLVLMLPGCVTPQKQAANDDAECHQMGARPGTDIFVQCRMFKQQQRSQQEQANSEALLAYGAQMLNSPQPARVQMDCTSHRMGVFVNTSCY